MTARMYALHAWYARLRSVRLVAVLLPLAIALLLSACDSGGGSSSGGKSY